VKFSRKEQIGRIDHFESLWDGLLRRYLNRDMFEDISAAKESEFLALQGAIMQELAAIAELEEGRFALVDEVTSVINEALSLRHLKDQSEFQFRRRKERARQVAELIADVRRFVAGRDSASERKEKQLEAKLARPFWDPEKGKFGVIVGRIVASPVRFFSTLRPTAEAKRANLFLLTLVSVLSAGCVISVTAFNAPVARTICYNFALETGILTSDAGALAKIAIGLLVVVGIAVVSLAGAMVAAILAHVLATLMHVSLKAVGAKGDAIASQKVVAFGLAPILLLIILPVVAYLGRESDVSSWLPVVLAAATVCYVAILHTIGFKKVHDARVAAGIVGWLVGVTLFAAVALAALWIWHAAVGNLPPSSGEYLYVTTKEAPMFRGSQRVSSTVTKGDILEFVGDKGEFYVVQHRKNKRRIKKRDAELREGSFLSLLRFLVESSAAQAEVLVDRLSRKVGKQAKQSS